MYGGNGRCEKIQWEENREEPSNDIMVFYMHPKHQDYAQLKLKSFIPYFIFILLIYRKYQQIYTILRFWD